MAHDPFTETQVHLHAPRKRKKKSRLWWILFVFVITLGTLGASTGVGLIIGYINSLPPIEKLEDYNPQQVTTVMDRTGTRTIGEFAEERRHVMSINEIPDQIKNAVLAIEDDRFYQHFGVDMKSVIRAFVINRQIGRAKQGASTITMQLPRNIIPEEVGREKKWDRKFKEMFLAFQIERRYSKDQILEFYLNHVPMGYPNWGIYAGADYYFSKEPKDLTLAEAATLAGVPNNPNIYNPITKPEKTKERRNLVLRRMRDLQMISEEQYERAINAPMVTRVAKRRVKAANSEYPYFVDALQRHLANFYELSAESLDRSGLTIRATIEPRFQEIAQEELKKGLKNVELLWNEGKQKRFYKEADELGALREGQVRLAHITDVQTTRTINVELNGYRGQLKFSGAIPYHQPGKILKVGNLIDVKITDVDSKARRISVKPGDTNQIQGSVVIMDAKNAEVLACIGGADFKDAGHNGQYNRAVMGGKPAGSTVKPFFYAVALERGWQPNSRILDEPTTFPSTPKDYRPVNYEHAFFGWTTLIEGLEHSRNVTTVKLFSAMGVKPSLRQVVRFDYRPGDSAWRTKFLPQLAVCLGSVDMNALEIASAYSVFTDQGIGRRPQFFTSAVDRDGVEALMPDPDEAEVIDPVSAYQIIYMLRKAVVSGTGKASIGDKFPSPPYPPICGKTGTTNDNTDAWFIGFTPDIVMCVYVGFDTPRSLGDKMTGGKIAAPIWASTFKRIYTTRDNWKMAYDVPPGIEYSSVDKDSGDRISADADWEGIYAKVPFRRGKGKSSREAAKAKPAPEQVQPKPTVVFEPSDNANAPVIRQSVQPNILGSQEPR